MGFGSGANEEWARAKEIYLQFIKTNNGQNWENNDNNKQKGDKNNCLNFNLKQNCQTD